MFFFLVFSDPLAQGELFSRLSPLAEWTDPRRTESRPSEDSTLRYVINLNRVVQYCTVDYCSTKSTVLNFTTVQESGKWEIPVQYCCMRESGKRRSWSSVSSLSVVCGFRFTVQVVWIVDCGFLLIIYYFIRCMYVCLVSIRPQTITKCSGVLSAAGRDTTT